MFQDHPVGFRAVEDALLAEVEALAGPRYSRDDGEPDLVRWGAQRGSIYLADQKLQISVPRVRDRREVREVPLATYAAGSNGQVMCACFRTFAYAGCEAPGEPLINTILH